MRVVMLVGIGGYRNGEPWPRAGGVKELPDSEAADLIAAGLAKAATDPEVPNAEPLDEPPAQPGDEPAGESDAQAREVGRPSPGTESLKPSARRPSGKRKR